MIPDDRARLAADATLIRRASDPDAEAIASVLLAAFARYEPQYTPAGFAATVIQPSEVRCRMREGPVWVAASADAIVGTVSAVLRGRAVYVRGMAVAPSAQGCRIGERLLEEVERFAIECNAALLELTTTPFLAAARHLYERYGFRRVPGEKSLFGTPLFAMEKTLIEAATGSTRASRLAGR